MSGLTCGLGKWFKTWFNKQESSVLADDGNEVEDRVFSMSDPIRNSEGQNGHGSHFI